MNAGAIVMAAGLGTRMKSDLPKVLHPLCGRPLLFYVLDLLGAIQIKKVVIVVSHRKDEIIKAVRQEYGKSRFLFIDQKTPKGTGDAILVTEPVFKSFKAPLFILSGDVPLLRPETLKAFFDHHQKSQAELTLGSALLDKETPYGRIIKNEKGDVLEVIEALDARPSQLNIQEMNIGLYCAHSARLYEALKKITPNNQKNEYYLTDIVKLLTKKSAYLIEDQEEVLGINNRMELYKKGKVLRSKINESWMVKGVTIEDSESTYIDSSVKLASDITLAPNVHLKGKTVIGKGTTIGVGSIIQDSKIGAGVQIKPYSIIEESEVCDQATIGPFARLRPQSIIKKKARVGNFVELKQTTLGEGSKANHLTYLGDAEIGKDVNVGCGVITCNYDGGLRYEGKAKTKIGDKSFVGSDCQLIAPLNIQKGAYIASGTTVTKDIPADSLVIARTEQTTKKGYMKKLWARARKRSKGKK